MPNVLYLLNFAGKAGTERYVETLVRRLGGAGITPFFAYNIEGGLAARMEEVGGELGEAITQYGAYHFATLKEATPYILACAQDLVPTIELYVGDLPTVMQSSTAVSPGAAARSVSTSACAWLYTRCSSGVSAAVSPVRHALAIFSPG